MKTLAKKDIKKIGGQKQKMFLSFFQTQKKGKTDKTDRMLK